MTHDETFAIIRDHRCKLTGQAWRCNPTNRADGSKSFIPCPLLVDELTGKVKQNNPEVRVKVWCDHITYSLISNSWVRTYQDGDHIWVGGIPDMDDMCPVKCCRKERPE